MSPHHCDSAGPESADSTHSLPSATSLLLLTPRLITATLNATSEVIQKTFSGAFTAEDTRCHHCHRVHPGHESCHVPETHCPSPCVCHINWSGCPGDSFLYELEITNTGSAEREFTLQAGTFPCTHETVTVLPDKATLAPGESFGAVVSYTIANELAGGRYQARLLLAGAYEQVILVSLNVGAKNSCCCHIEQGDIPRKIRAHHWYHHFQCVEDCFPPARKAATP